MRSRIAAAGCWVVGRGEGGHFAGNLGEGRD